MRLPVAIALFAAFAFTAAPLPAEENEDGFVSLFDGKTLDGWEGLPGSWEVRNGEIWCTGQAKEKNWLIRRKEQPANFILRLEFRWDKGNSGVQVRSDDLGDFQITGYQVEVAERDVMGLWHHSLLAKDHPKKEVRHLMTTAGQSAVISEDGKKTVERKADPAEVKSHYREHEWNTLEIIADGDTLIQKINGVEFSRVTDRDAEMSRKRGFIALQDHGKGCTVAFRKFRLKALR